MRRIPVAVPCATFDGVTVVLDELAIDADSVSAHLGIDAPGRERTFRGGERFHMRMRFALTDTIGTSYLPTDAIYGADGWRAYWRFRPAPPGEVNRLTVTAYLDGASVSEHVINLDPQ